MRLAEIPAADPPALLAWDEAFLTDADEGGEEVLWFWESPVPFVVVGYGQAIGREVNGESCHQQAMPVLRRCSGGGAVVQGPGCLNYGVVLRWADRQSLASVTEANRWIMQRNAGALRPLLAGRVEVQGHTDLALLGADAVWRKFSGNAQKRARQALLFHGTILHGLDLALVSALLPRPVEQPAYRANRSHAEFLTNLELTPATIRAALTRNWEAGGTLAQLPFARHQTALAERYLRQDWHGRR